MGRKEVDQTKLLEFMHKAISDIASSSSAILIILGERLGLYRALSESEYSLTSNQLAKKTGTVERLVREWLCNQVAGGYVSYDPKSNKYYLSEEQKLALADENSPVYIHGAFKFIKSYFRDEEEFVKMFRNERKFAWEDHHNCMAEGVAEFFKPGYVANLLNLWIPSLDGIHEKLLDGAKVADVGCGFGFTTSLMAKAYPNSTFIGFDSHRESIEKAKRITENQHLKNLSFQVSSAYDFPGHEYDFITFFDCVHDMGDPIKALTHAYDSLKKDTKALCMIVEPFATEKLENNITPVSRTFYSTSTLICVPNSLAFNGPALGAQAGEEKIKELVLKSGFSKFRRVMDSPVNIIYEIRP
ncbi:MAG: class I SAM-dependent methyltransferase [Nitrososphaeraceae archaeon]